MMCVSCELCEECVACSVMCSFLSVKKSERVWPLRGEGGGYSQYSDVDESTQHPDKIK